MAGQKARRDILHAFKDNGKEIKKTGRRQGRKRAYTRQGRYRPKAQDRGKEGALRRPGDRPDNRGRPQRAAAYHKRQGDRSLEDGADREQGGQNDRGHGRTPVAGLVALHLYRYQR